MNRMFDFVLNNEINTFTCFNTTNVKSLGKDILFGVAVGDALGVPFEFRSRKAMLHSPATTMVGHGTHDQPAGTWSDDSSLTFCLAEAICEGYSLECVAQKFIQWKNDAYWTARYEVFDIGIRTSTSISNLEHLLRNRQFKDLALLKYSSTERDNGNGSLMRILPLITLWNQHSLKEWFEFVWQNSALTHGHFRAAMSCFIYLQFACNLIRTKDKYQAYRITQEEVNKFWESEGFSDSEYNHFRSILAQDIRTLPKSKVLSGGYVIESLECSFWSFLNSDSYEEAVLTSINFGHDTDTTAAITGGLGEIYYGYESISEYWRASLSKMESIENLGERLDQCISTQIQKEYNTNY